MRTEERPTRLDGRAEPKVAERRGRSGADDLGPQGKARGGADSMIDWASCDDVLRAHARTFSFGSYFLPKHRRRAIAAAYAYCRIADDLVDCAPRDGLDAIMLGLDAWERELDAPRHPVAVAFAFARDQFGVPEQPVRDLLRGVRMDLVPRRYETWAQLREYCYHVAGTIGLISAPIFGCSDEAALPHAVDLGVAMQLTNILRDVAEDAAIGRLYLPLEDLLAFAVDPESVLQLRPNGRFTELIEFEIERARELYRSARLGIPALCPSGQLTTLAISHLYSQILHRIEAQRYDVFVGRAFVPTHRKLRAMPRITADFLRLQLAPPIWS